MPMYVTVSRGAPGEREVVPILASTDPQILRKVIRVFADVLIDGEEGIGRRDSTLGEAAKPL